jgi:hypothetical protein
MRTLALIAGAVVIVGGVASWLAIVTFTWMATRHVKPGVRLWGRETFWNPSNVLVLPHLLTARGLVYRRMCFRATLAFLFCVAMAFLLLGIPTR